MAIVFERVTLELSFGDGEAVLAYRDERLIAVLSHLGMLHGELAGRWFVEALIGDGLRRAGETFVDLSDFATWADSPP